MSKKLVIATLIAFIVSPVVADETSELDSSDNGQTVHIKFSSVEPEEGKIWVAVCTEAQLEERYQSGGEVCAAEQWVEAKEDATVSFDELAPGIYAITAFHDEDGNGTLDFDTRGIPFEATGNGNNAKGRFGPPSFDQMKFELHRHEDGETSQHFNLKFYRAGPFR